MAEAGWPLVVQRLSSSALVVAATAAAAESGVQSSWHQILERGGPGGRESIGLKAETSAGVINSFLAEFSSGAPCGG